MDEKFSFSFLSGNALKIIALVTMTIDHIGAYIFPQLIWLRVIGRIAYPIFAFMIAEGCFYTKHKLRYFLEVLGVGVLCQIFYFIYAQRSNMCIMIVFAFSILIIFAIQKAKKSSSSFMSMLPIGLIIGAYIFAEVLPRLLFSTKFSVDYGFIGIMLPVIVYIAPDFKRKLVYFTGGLILLSLFLNSGIQFWGLLSVPLLILYNGKRGKLKMKHFFYVYYPVHIVVVWLIGNALH